MKNIIKSLLLYLAFITCAAVALYKLQDYSFESLFFFFCLETMFAGGIMIQIKEWTD